MILYFIVVRMTREMRRIDILSIFAYIFCIHILHTHIYIYTLKHTHVMNCIAESDCEIISYHISQYHMCTVCISIYCGLGVVLYHCFILPSHRSGYNSLAQAVLRGRKMDLERAQA